MRGGIRFRPLSPMSLGGILLSGLLLLPPLIPKTIPRASPWVGREVFEAKGCLHCHAVFGKGGWGGPDLGKHLFFGTYLELSALIWNHLPKMSRTMRKIGVEFPKFRQEEMEQLISYLSFIRYQGRRGKEFRGRNLLETKGCTSCHSFGGAGGDIGPDFSEKKEYLSPLFLVESMWNHGPGMMELFLERGVARPFFLKEEIIDLAAGIQSYMSPTMVPIGSFDLGDPERGESLVQEKGCMRCHSFRGAGGDLGPDFDQLEFGYSVIQFAGRMWNHGPKMWEIMQREAIPVPLFRKGEMAHIIAYIYELKMVDRPGDGKEGRETVRKKGCLTCHSVQAEGGNIAKDLGDLGALDNPAALITAMWNHAPRMQEKLLEKDLEWPELNGRDMANLYTYFREISSAGAGEPGK